MRPNIHPSNAPISNSCPTVEEQDELNDAFALAQAEMPNAALNKVNPHFNSRYADLASIREATLPALTKHGLSIRQFCELSDDGAKLVLVTRLAHKSGQYEDSRYPIALDRPQAMGSSLTYARRYNWAAICGVGSEEDDDAEEAEREAPAKKTKAKARLEKDYQVLVELLRETTTKAEVTAFISTHRDKIEALPDDWQATLGTECRRHKEGLAE